MQQRHLPIGKAPELQLIYDTAPIGLAFLSPDCRYVQINQRLTEICGISVADHIGRSVRETVPAVADQVEAIVASVLTTGEPVNNIEVNGQRADGLNAEHAWLTHWYPLKAPDGMVVGVSVVAEDVTERKRAAAELAASEKALRDSEARFRELTDNMSQMAWTADPAGRRTWYNRRWLDYTGASLEEMLGWGWQKAHHPDHLDRVLRRFHPSFESGTPWEDTFPLRGRDGSYRWFLTRALPIRDENGAIVRWFGTNTDVTDQVEAENALRDSEARFRELADNMSQFAWTADATGWIYWYNKRWHDYTGASLEEMQGWGWAKVHHPDHVDSVVRRIRNSFENGTPWEDTFPLRGRDGNYRWFLSRALPIRNDDGEVVRWFGTNTDVTEQIEAENALRELNASLEQRVEAETQERLRVWNVSQDLLLVADGEGRFLNVNPAWTAALGWGEADLVGKTLEWLLHPDDRERTDAEIRRVLAGERASRFRNRLRHKDGSYCWLSWRASLDEGHIYAVARDITELRKTEAALAATRDELARVTRQATVAAMTASIAHEINQPLAAITTNANAGLRWLGRDPPDLDEVRATLRRIGEDGRRASDIIAGIRAMFRKDAQERQPVSVNALVREILTLVEGELDKRVILAESDLADAVPDIMAERVQLQQVILNLVMNAAEAMSAVTDRKRALLVRSRAERQDVLISVADSGPGIEPNDAERIFEAFYTTKSHGMGMGLAICRSIVGAHGGRLWAEPRSPHGAVFHVRLPVAGSTA
jgi:PAS domain S-box-containing protein